MSILSFALVALAIFYLVICLLALIRLIKVITLPSKSFLSIALYFGLLIASIARAVSLYLISTKLIEPTGKSDELDILVYLMIVMPDVLITCVYLFLVWYFFSNFIQAHINLANDLNVFLKTEDTPAINDKTRVLLYVIVPLYFCAFTILVILSFLNVIKDSTVYMISSYFDIITPVLTCTYYIFLLIKFSGRPYINPTFRSGVKRIFIVAIVWTVARLVRIRLSNA